MSKNSRNSVPPAAYIIINILFIFFVLVCIIPFALVVSVSLTDNKALIEHGYRFIPETFSVDAYKFLFSNSRIVINAYKVTIFTTIIGTLANVILMAMFAYPLSRYDFPFKKTFSTFVLITMLFNAGLTPTYMVNVNILHLRNTIWALILPALGGGFNIFVMRTYFRLNIPKEIIESTKIDGASEIRIFVQMVIPLALPVMAAIGLFNSITFWNNWALSLYYISDTKLFSLQYVMQQALLNMQFMQQTMQADSNTGQEMLKNLPEESVRMAMVIVGIGPILLAYPFFQKYFVKGLTVGAVKG